MISWWIFPAVLSTVVALFIILCAWGSGDVAFKDLIVWLLVGFGAAGCAAFWVVGYLIKVFAS